MRVLALMLGALLSLPVLAQSTAPQPQAAVDWQWGVKIPLRDGVRLNATVYRPRGQSEPLPCIFTLTPYISQSYHDRGMYFAAHGYVFLTIDVRGRGNSEGQFRPAIQEGDDGRDVVEWLAQQRYCNGKVTMWGGSYAGHNQWLTASRAPRGLATIVPAASPYFGIDFPMAGNIPSPYIIQWLTFVSGHAAQDRIFGDRTFWQERFADHYVNNRPFNELDRAIGNPSPIFQEWVAHPRMDEFWDAYNPSARQYAAMSLPILTITGHYDGDQPGAMEHYRRHLDANPAAASNHFLIIGPWDHAQTRTPGKEIGGLKLGDASLLDLNDLHRQWYDWTMKQGARPGFLQKNVAYYVTAAEAWRYSDTLQAVTREHRPFYLASDCGIANDVFQSGRLQAKPQARGVPDRYVYDPLDTSIAEIEAALEFDSLKEQRQVLLSGGKSLIYHSALFEQDTEISGFFRLDAWIEIDQPDTDFAATVYEIAPDGSSLLLSSTVLRARYRESLRREVLVTPGKVLEYRFEQFPFVARRIAKGSRLRLVFGPVSSTYQQKNYNSGGVVAQETARDARPVTVRLFHDARHPSALFVPIGAGDGAKAPAEQVSSTTP